MSPQMSERIPARIDSLIVNQNPSSTSRGVLPHDVEVEVLLENLFHVSSVSLPVALGNLNEEGGACPGAPFSQPITVLRAGIRSVVRCVQDGVGRVRPEPLLVDLVERSVLLDRRERLVDRFEQAGPSPRE